MNQMDEENLEEGHFFHVMCYQRERRLLEKLEGKKR